MHVIALKGKNESGKTATLRRLIRYIVQNGGSFICENDKKRFERAEEREGDVSLPLLLNGRLIAITTCGDAPSMIRPFYENYRQYADVFVCATHPEGTASYRYVCGWETEHTVEFVPKQTESNEERHHEHNQEEAKFLFQYILNEEKVGEEL